MKVFRPHRNRRCCIQLVLAALFFAFGCNRDETGPAPEFSHELSSARQNQSRGEALFRGIFLLEGEIAQKIDMYEPLLAEISEQSKKTPGFSKERAAYNTRLIEKIKELDKGYLDRLAAAVESKEYLAINEAFEHGALLLKGIFFLEMSDKLQYELSDQVVKLNPSSFDLSKKSELVRFVALAKKQLPEDKIMKLLKEDPAYSAQMGVAFAAAFAAAFVAVAVVWDVAVLINVAAAVNVVAAVFALVTVTVNDSPPTDEAPDDDDDREPGSPEEPGGPINSFLSGRASAPEKGNLQRELFLKQVAFDL